VVLGGLYVLDYGFLLLVQTCSDMVVMTTNELFVFLILTLIGCSIFYGLIEFLTWARYYLKDYLRQRKSRIK
jgi:hypothetical protein